MRAEPALGRAAVHPVGKRYWHLVHAPSGDAAWNMAVDEALWNAAGPDISPTVRLHHFDRDCVTLGFAQSQVELLGTGLDHLPWARRLTGGGSIHHHDCTVSFSLIAGDLGHLGIARRGGQREGGAVACAMGEFLVEVWRCLSLETKVLAHGDPATQESPLCADRLYPGDVVCGKRKVAGIGQRHRRGRLLVQAALLLDRAPPDRGVIERCLQSAVSEKFNAEVEPRGLTEIEREAAEKLRAECFSAEQTGRGRPQEPAVTRSVINVGGNRG